MTEPIYIEDAEELYQDAPFGYLTMYGNGKILNINNTLLDWMGYNRMEILGQKSFSSLLSIGGRIYLETHIMPILQLRGEIAEINIEFKKKDGTKLPTLINAKKVKKHAMSQPVFRLSVLDISQRKHYELELMKAQKKAEQMVQRLQQINQELEEFAYTASHDLQAPLSTISGLIGLLEKKGMLKHDAKAAKYFSVIKNNTDRMKLMIRDLLEYAKIDGKEPEMLQVSLNEVCDITLEILEEQIHLHQATVIIPELPVVVGDNNQLIRLFQNLIGNSLKYRSESAPRILVEFEEREQEFCFFVKDNGMGFNQSLAPQLFEFMKRLHSHSTIAGTGIGLSACKRIVELHGGIIGATSEEGKGSTFYFTLPKKEIG